MIKEQIHIERYQTDHDLNTIITRSRGSVYRMCFDDFVRYPNLISQLNLFTKDNFGTRT